MSRNGFPLSEPASSVVMAALRSAAAVFCEIDWLTMRAASPVCCACPGPPCLLRAETRYFISSRALTAADAAKGRCGEHRAIENRLRLRGAMSPSATTSRACARAHGARNTATVRHFALPRSSET
jgi:hypothetical protein